MNQEIKRAWIAALRSGEYRQGQTELHNVEKNTFCCLGVLCDLHMRATSAGSWGDFGVYLGECATLPSAVVDWAGVPDYNPNVEDGRGECIAEVNDNGATFEEIADIIEAQL